MTPGVYSLTGLLQAVQSQPEDWRPLVLTNGCFDLLHAGHLRYLRVAETLGRPLVVGLNIDHSVQQIKPAAKGSPSRPIVPEAQRAEVLAALKPVDGVVVFSESTATQLVQALKPEIYVKGGNYQVETLPEARVVQAYGRRVELVQIEVLSSTTGMISRILQNCLSEVPG